MSKEELAKKEFNGACIFLYFDKNGCIVIDKINYDEKSLKYLYMLAKDYFKLDYEDMIKKINSY